MTGSTAGAASGIAAADAAASADAVFSGIAGEIRDWAGLGLEGSLRTLYFGGGTPSLVPGQVASVIRLVRECFDVSPAIEITVEANPDALAPAALETLLCAGVNRISLGVQSFDDGALAFLGRRHNAERALEAARLVCATGAALSLDLICGIPGQQGDGWRETLEAACAIDAGHVSVYPLSVEAQTPLALRIEAEEVADIDPDVQAEEMLVAAQVLEARGYERYEVANYARSPAECSRHNTAYWIGAPYVGIGPGAHGMVEAARGAVEAAYGVAEAAHGRVRWANAKDIGCWWGEAREVELLTREEALREDAMLGMRLVCGIADELVVNAELGAVMASLEADGLVRHASGRWQATERGWLLGNEVFSRIWNAASSLCA